MHRPKGWKKIIEQNSHRSGSQEGHKGWQSVFAEAKKPARVDEGNGDWQANIKQGARTLQPRPQDKSLAYEKWELQTKTGIEGVQIQVEYLRVSGRYPLEESTGEILRRNQEQRRNEGETQQSAGRTIRPNGAHTHSSQTAQSRERKPRGKRGFIVQNLKIDCGEEECTAKNQYCILQGRCDAKVNDDNAREGTGKENGSERLDVELPAAAEPDSAGNQEERENAICDLLTGHLLVSSAVFCRERVPCTRRYIVFI